MNPRGSWSVWKWLLVALILIGFGLRLHNLGAFGFWVDEAITGLLARYPVAEMLRYTRSHGFEHPPLYYAMLHLWMLWAGDTEWTLRFFAVLWGVLAIAASFAVFIRMGDPPLALLGALVLTVAPFHVAYSQENRMYSWVAFLGAWSTLLFVRLLSKPSRKLLVAYAFSSLVGIFSHYLFVLLPLAHLAYALFAAATGGNGNARRAARSLGVVLLISGIVALVWVALSPGPSQMAEEILGSFRKPSALTILAFRKLGKVSTDLALSEPREPHVPAAVLLTTAGLWIVVGWASAKAAFGAGSRREPLLLAVFWLFFPLVALLLIPRGAPGRFLSHSVSAFAFLLALGMAQFWARFRPAVLIPIALLLGVIGYGYQQIYAVSKGDFHLAVTYVRENARPGDAMLLTHPYFRPLALYYLRDAPVDVFVVPGELRPPSPEEVEEELPQVFQKHERLWLGPINPGTLELDERNLVANWLNLNAFQVEKKWFPQSSYVALYLPPLESPALLKRAPVGAAGSTGPFNVYLPLVSKNAGGGPYLRPATEYAYRFGELAVLEEAYLEATELRAGSGLRMLFRWRILSKTSDEVLVSIELRDADGALWAHRLGPMQGGLLPGTRWRPGLEVEDRHGLWVSECTPPGEYSLQLKLYDVTRGVSLPVWGGDHVELARVRVLPGPEPRPCLGLNFSFGDSLALLGADCWPEEIAQGQSLPVTLYWLPSRALGPDLELRLELRDGRGRVWTSSQAPLGPRWYGPESWEAGVCFKGLYALAVPGRLPPGRYRLTGTVVAGGKPWAPSGAGEVWPLGTVEVRPLERIFRRPRFRHRADATLEGVARLVGYDIEPAPGASVAPGEAVKLTLYWQAIGEPEREYTVFTHLVGPDGKIWGQKDNPPVRGARPTTTWVKGEYVADEYLIPLNPQAPPGRYTLYVGMYDPATGQRVPARDAQGKRYPNDAIPLATLMVGADAE